MNRSNLCVCCDGISKGLVMVEDIFGEDIIEEKPRAKPKSPRRFQPDLMLKTKACNVCGQTLFMYMRICDRCGSIQRPVSGNGIPIPQEEMEICERCGKPNIRKEDKLMGKLICSECEQAAKAQEKKKSRTKTRAAIAAGSMSAAAIAATIWAVVGHFSAAVSFAIFSISGLTIALAITATLIIYLNEKKKSSPVILPKKSEEEESLSD